MQRLAGVTRGRIVVLGRSGRLLKKERRLNLFFPVAVHEWGVHENSLNNIARAIGERVFSVSQGGVQVPPPQPERGFVRRELRGFADQLSRHVGKVVPMSTEEFVDTYNGKKRRLYEMAAASLELVPLQQKDAFITAFIKDEKTNLTLKQDPCPRIIQPRSPRFNIEIGKYLKPMEKAVFRGIAAIFQDVTVFKGYNAQERGTLLFRKWKRFIHPVAIMLDASRMDQHCSEDIIKWEHSLWERLCPESRLKTLNRMRYVNKCYARAPEGGYKYTLPGRRMSGDMDTAMGNCTTMCAMTWSFMRSIGVAKYDYCNDGDDGVLIVEEEHLRLVLDTFQSYFLKHGFTMKLEGISRTMEGIEFCQAHPIYDGEHWKFVRDPRICLGKDCLAIGRFNTADSLEEQRNAVGWCGASLAGDMPIFCALYKQLICGNRPMLTYDSGMQFLASRMEPVFSQPTDEARVSFYKAYGILPDTQISIETSLLTTPPRKGPPVLETATTIIPEYHYYTTTHF